MNIEMSVGLRGLYKLIIRDAETLEIKRETDWFDNLILDNGTNRMSNGAIASVAVVGTGNTTPNVTQTALVAIVGSTTTIQASSHGVGPAVSPWYTWVRRTYRFAAGTATGNLSEVGVGWATNQLWSRALIVDGGGSPTTITVLSTEVLDVVYELRSYMEESDVIFQIQIGPVLHDCVLRPANIDTAWTDAITVLSIFENWSSGVLTASAYDGAIGTITGLPAGAQASSTSTSIAAYVNNSRQRDMTYTWSLPVANFAGGIDAVVFNSNIGRFQVGFTAPINKTSGQQLTLTFRWAWARFTP